MSLPETENTNRGRIYSLKKWARRERVQDWVNLYFEFREWIVPCQWAILYLVITTIELLTRHFSITLNELTNSVFELGTILATHHNPASSCVHKQSLGFWSEFLVTNSVSWEVEFPVKATCYPMSCYLIHLWIIVSLMHRWGVLVFTVLYCAFVLIVVCKQDWEQLSLNLVWFI